MWGGEHPATVCTITHMSHNPCPPPSSCKNPHLHTPNHASTTVLSAIAESCWHSQQPTPTNAGSVHEAAHSHKFSLLNGHVLTLCHHCLCSLQLLNQVHLPGVGRVAVPIRSWLEAADDPAVEPTGGFNSTGDLTVHTLHATYAVPYWAWRLKQAGMRRCASALRSLSQHRPGRRRCRCRLATAARKGRKASFVHHHQGVHSREGRSLLPAGESPLADSENDRSCAPTGVRKCTRASTAATSPAWAHFYGM
jgi:hypothetical protein